MEIPDNFYDVRNALRPALRLAMGARLSATRIEYEDVNVAAMDAVRRLAGLDAPPDYAGVAAALACLAWRLSGAEASTIKNGSEWMPTEDQLVRAVGDLARFVYGHIEAINRVENAYLYDRVESEEA